MIVLVGAEQVRLDDRNVLGEGGEGRVYRHRDLALKIFATPTPERAAKLRAFPVTMPAGVVGPE